MATYDSLFNVLGLRDWCDQDKVDGPLTMAQLMARARGGAAQEKEWWEFPFPSLDELNAACKQIPRSRDLTAGLERLFLDARDDMRVVLDPLTQPLSWALDGSLYFFNYLPWFAVVPAIVLISLLVSRSIGTTALVATCFGLFLFIDYYTYAIQTVSIIFVCTAICVTLGVPLGIAMARSDKLRSMMIPVLDMLQTLPPFVYLIPLIFMFSVTESKLYGIAIILYAIVPVVRLTDLGIRLVDRDVIEAANAFGMTNRQKLYGVQIPLAMPNIMAGINQTIMMSLAMVVIASLVSAPGLGVLVLRGIRNLELGVGLVAGLCIVSLAVMLDRVSKASLARINKAQKS